MEPSTTDDEMLVTENVQVCLDGGTRAEVMGFNLKCSTDYVQSQSEKREDKCVQLEFKA